MQGISHHRIQVLLLPVKIHPTSTVRFLLQFILHPLIFQVPLLEMLQLRHVSELLLLGTESEEPQVDASDAGILHRGKLRLHSSAISYEMVPIISIM